MLTRCFTFIAMRFAIRCVLGFSEAMFFYCALCVMGACFDVNQYSLVTWAAHFNGRRFQDHIVWNTYCNGDWWQISIATKWQQSVCLGGGVCVRCVRVCVCAGWGGLGVGVVVKTAELPPLPLQIPDILPTMLLCDFMSGLFYTIMSTDNNIPNYDINHNACTWCKIATIYVPLPALKLHRCAHSNGNRKPLNTLVDYPWLIM